MPATDQQPAIRLRRLAKSYGSVVALDGVPALFGQDLDDRRLLVDAMFEQ